MTVASAPSGSRPPRSRLRKVVAILASGVVASYYGTALLERWLPHRWLRRFQRTFGTPGGDLMTRLPGWGIVETTGRRSGETRRVPVGGRIVGNDFWLVAADPRRAGYVRNIEANPKVRIRVGGTWREGVAHLLPGDNARWRMLRINPVNGLYIAVAGREHLTIRVALDPVAPGTTG